MTLTHFQTWSLRTASSQPWKGGSAIGQVVGNNLPMPPEFSVLQLQKLLQACPSQWTELLKTP